MQRKTQRNKVFLGGVITTATSFELAILSIISGIGNPVRYLKGVDKDGNEKPYYTDDEIESSLKLPLVQKLIELIRLRNSHKAFKGEFRVEAPEENLLEMRWEQNEHWIMLHVDLSTIVAVITGSDLEKKIRYMV